MNQTEPTPVDPSYPVDPNYNNSSNQTGNNNETTSYPTHPIANETSPITPVGNETEPTSNDDDNDFEVREV